MKSLKPLRRSVEEARKVNPSSGEAAGAVFMYFYVDLSYEET